MCIRDSNCCSRWCYCCNWNGDNEFYYRFPPRTYYRLFSVAQYSSRNFSNPYARNIYHNTNLKFFETRKSYRKILWSSLLIRHLLASIRPEKPVFLDKDFFWLFFRPHPQPPRDEIEWFLGALD